MNKQMDLQYYLDLHYNIILDSIEEEGERFYRAFARELDRLMFFGIGESEQKAIEELKTCMREMFTYCLDEGIAIPEPVTAPDLLYSGKFLVRTSPATHSNLVYLARENQQSLNSFINTLLTQYITARSVSDSATVMIREAMCAEIKKVGDTWVLSQQEIKLPPTSSTKEDRYATAS